MDTKLRTLAKALTWQALGLATTGLIAWVYTGSVLAALGVALSTSAPGLGFFVLHERLWARVTWGLRQQQV